MKAVWQFRNMHTSSTIGLHALPHATSCGQGYYHNHKQSVRKNKETVFVCGYHIHNCFLGGCSQFVFPLHESLLFAPTLLKQIYISAKLIYLCAWGLPTWFYTVEHRLQLCVRNTFTIYHFLCVKNVLLVVHLKYEMGWRGMDLSR